MRRGRLFCALLLLGAVALSVAAQPEKEPISAWQGEMIRLHVIAAGDDAENQRVKLCVRDALLAAFADRLTAADFDAASAAVQANLPEIQAVAQRTAAAQGFSGEVTAEFGRFDFPTREYGGLRVPAGEYTALRVVLGGGEGRNWWCVMYPALCLSGDCTETQQAALPTEGGEKQADVQFESTLWQWLKAVWPEGGRQEHAEL